MPSVTYLRLDGSIAAANRFEIVNKSVVVVVIVVVVVVAYSWLL